MCLNCDHDHPILPPGLDRSLIVMSKGGRFTMDGEVAEMPAIVFVMARTNEELDTKVHEVVVMDAEGRDDGHHFHIVQGQGALGPVVFNQIGSGDLDRWERVLVTGNDAYDREIELERYAAQHHFQEHGTPEELEEFLGQERYWWVSSSSIGVPDLGIKAAFHGAVILKAVFRSQARKLVHNNFFGIDNPLDVDARELPQVMVSMMDAQDLGRVLNKEEAQAIAERLSTSIETGNTLKGGGDVAS